MKIQFIFLFLILLPYVNGQDFILLEGKIIEAESKAPLPFASVSLVGNSIGTITNENGEFSLKLPEKFIDKEVVFSYLGYRKKTIPIKSNIGILLEIKLEVEPKVLHEVNVKYITPEELITSSLQRVGQNYPNKPNLLQAFYREKIKEDEEPIEVIEAVVEIYKSKYTDKKDKDRIRMIKGRQQDSLKKSVFFDYLYFVNGPYEALQLDVAKYPEGFIQIVQSSYNFLDPKHFKYFDYKYNEQAIKQNGLLVDVIAFKPKKERVLFEGEIVIDRESKAILSVEYFIGKEKLEYAQLIKYEHETYINNKGCSTKAKSFHCKVEFKKVGDRYVLSNSRLNYSFRFYSKDWKSFDISNSIFLVVTSVETENVQPIKKKESIWKGSKLSRQLGKPDPGFWENYNVVVDGD